MSDAFTKKVWKLAHGRELILGPEAILMGILNVTPDSFSDGGQYLEVEKACHKAVEMKQQGATIIDIGGESTRPGAEPISATLEQDRILPVIEKLVSDVDVILSVDTYRASTARYAIAAGAHIVNDVWGGQKETDILKVAGEHSAGLCLMHTGREREKAQDVILDQRVFLNKSLSLAVEHGVKESQIVLDPGFGFAKDEDECLRLLSRLEELHDFEFPLMLGTSRKRFIGSVTNRDAEERDVGTAATSVIGRMKGAAIFRVHNIPVNKDALAIVDATIATNDDGKI